MADSVCGTHEVPVSRATVINSSAPCAEEVVITRFGIRINLSYLFSVRGTLNIIQMLLGLIALSMNAYYCQFRTLGRKNVGFLCGHPDTYFFVVNCTFLITTVLLFVCCLFSMETATLLLNTIYELAYHVLAHVLYLTSSVSLLVSVLQRNADYADKEYGFAETIVASVIGLLNCIAYAASAAWLKWIGKRKV